MEEDLRREVFRVWMYTAEVLPWTRFFATLQALAVSLRAKVELAVFQVQQILTSCPTGSPTLEIFDLRSSLPLWPVSLVV